MQGPLEEVYLGDTMTKRPTYISAKLNPSLKTRAIKVLKEFLDYFVWDYNEMPRFSLDLVKLRLPIIPNKRHENHTPGRFVSEVMSKIKAEIERLLKSKFIRLFMYVEWLANIILVIKNGTLRVSIDFINLNVATPKGQCYMFVAEILVDLAAGFEYLNHFI